MPIKPNEVQLVAVGRTLTPASGYLRGYTHTLNPYVGCAFGENGCGVYCYVAESPVGVFAGAPWGTWLRAKTNAADALRRELRRTADPGAVCIFMSSATDPYQPAESHLRITRSILQVLLEHPVRLLVVQTRSPLIQRDFDLLEQMPFAWLSMTIETDDDVVRRVLTPACPSIHRRLDVMRAARARGILVQAAVSPALPHHREAFVETLASAADRVVVDTLFGDGAEGKRSARRPVAARYTELGWGDWRDTTAAAALHATLIDRMGPGRVGWAKDGFNALAVNPERGGGKSPPCQRMLLPS
jgi:DNA repair photolyase